MTSKKQTPKIKEDEVQVQKPVLNLTEKKAALAVINQKDKLRDYLLERKVKVEESMIEMEEFLNDDEKSIFEDSIDNFPFSIALLKEGAYASDTKKIMVIKKASVVRKFSEILENALVCEITKVENELTNLHL